MNRVIFTNIGSINEFDKKITTTHDGDSWSNPFSDSIDLSILSWVDIFLFRLFIFHNGDDPSPPFIIKDFYLYYTQLLNAREFMCCIVLRDFSQGIFNLILMLSPASLEVDWSTRYMGRMNKAERRRKYWSCFRGVNNFPLSLENI